MELKVTADFRDRVVVVTGGARGMGRVYARHRP